MFTLTNTGGYVRLVVADAHAGLAKAVRMTVAAASRAEKLSEAIRSTAFRGQLVPTEAELARQEGRD